MSDSAEVPTQATISINMSDADVYKIFADQIIKEDALINQRMTWGLISNAAGLTLIGAIYGACKDFTKLNPLLYVGFFIILILSIYLTRQTILSIQDARRQIYYIRDVYEKHWSKKFDSIGLPRPFGSRLTTHEALFNLVEPFTIQLPDRTPATAIIFLRKMYPNIGRKQDFRGKRPFWWWAERMLAAIIWTWVAILIAGAGVVYSRWP